MLMIDEIGLEITFRKINQRLKEAGISYHCTGGLAAMLYGEPRFTQDMDLVIKSSESLESIHRLIASLGVDFIYDREFITEEFRRKGLFQAIDKETCVKVDFHVGESIPGELERSVFCEYVPGLIIPFVSKEDAILSKLLWIKKGSHKSRQDVVMMLRRPGPLDREALALRANDLGVSDLLQELKTEADH